jgi:hypothetical protein
VRWKLYKRSEICRYAPDTRSIPLLYKIYKNHVPNDSLRIQCEHYKENEWWLWLHFGVHGGAKTFLLEQRAYNDATFRCPDERGYMVCVNNDISRLPASSRRGVFRPRHTACSPSARCSQIWFRYTQMTATLLVIERRLYR